MDTLLTAFEAITLIAIVGSTVTLFAFEVYDSLVDQARLQQQVPERAAPLLLKPMQTQLVVKPATAESDYYPLAKAA